MTNNIVEPDETSRGIDTQGNSQSESEEERYQAQIPRINSGPGEIYRMGKIVV